jgi:hypothetical protein
MRLLAALAAVLASGALAAGAGAHRSACHTHHTCPSDHHTYAWQGLWCTSYADERVPADTQVVRYDGRTYWCHGARAAAEPADDATGKAVLLAPRSRTSGCRLGALPDRRCSPGAYDAALTTSRICSPDFRTSTIRHVTTAMRHAVEVEYGLAPRAYGRTLEIDHVVPLELGGSNALANLFPERGYQAKDRLENRLHALVCSGSISLRSAQRGIASDWQALYRRVFGSAA